MKPGDQIRISDQAVRVYGFDSNIGLIVDKVPQSTYSAALEYPDDYHVLVDGVVVHMGYAIENDCEVISESR